MPVRVVLAVLVALFVLALAWRSPETGSHRIGVERWSEQVERQAVACASGAEPGVLLIAPYNREVALDCPAIVGAQ